MKPETTLWVEKAEEDFRAAKRLLPVTDEPTFNVVAFLAQQTVEKYMKALLQEHQSEFDKTHNLIYLLELLLPALPLWDSLRPALRRLNSFAVDFRYPGESAVKEDAMDAYSIAREIRKLSREELGIK